MDYVIIITVIAICLSFYSISAPYHKRHLLYHFSKDYYFRMLIIFILLLISILMGEYLNLSGERQTSFIINFLSLLLSLIFIGLFVYLLFNKRIENFHGFIENIRRQLDLKNYGEITTDLDIYFDSIIEKYSKIKSDETIENDYIYEFEYLLMNDNFVFELSIRNPRLGTKLMENLRNIKTNVMFDFSDLFLDGLIKNVGSILYSQISKNQNLRMDSNCRYLIPKRNYLLFTLFNDINVAKELDVWRPIGEGVLEYLNKQKYTEVDENNFEPRDYEKDKWASPVFIGIRFFEIMVYESIANNIERHMWLFYFNHFSKHICENIKYEEGADKEDPNYTNMYEYYLNEIFSVYIGWVNTIYSNFRTPHEEEIYKIPLSNVDSSHENNNIIKSALISLSQSMEYVAKSSNLRRQYKINLFDMVLNLYFKFILSNLRTIENYGKVLYCLFKEKRDKNFYEILKSALGIVDKPRFSLDVKSSEKFDKKFEELESLVSEKLV